MNKKALVVGNCLNKILLRSSCIQRDWMSHCHDWLVAQDSDFFESLKSESVSVYFSKNLQSNRHVWVAGAASASLPDNIPEIIRDSYKGSLDFQSGLALDSLMSFVRTLYVSGACEKSADEIKQLIIDYMQRFIAGKSQTYCRINAFMVEFLDVLRTIRHPKQDCSNVPWFSAEHGFIGNYTFWYESTFPDEKVTGSGLFYDILSMYVERYGDDSTSDRALHYFQDVILRCQPMMHFIVNNWVALPEQACRDDVFKYINDFLTIPDQD